MGKATHYTTENASAAAEDLYATILIEAPLAEGDKLLIAIAAKTEAASTEEGKAILGIRIKD